MARRRRRRRTWSRRRASTRRAGTSAAQAGPESASTSRARARSALCRRTRCSRGPGRQSGPRNRSARPPLGSGGSARLYALLQSMGRNVPEKIKTKGGHQPRARIHAGWSPIGQHHRRVAILRALGVLVAVALVLGFAVDAYAQTFFDSLPSIRGLDSAAFAGDTLISDRNGRELADVGYHTGDHRLAVRLQDISPNMINATIAIEDKNFYSNPGFDATAILRALYDDLRTGHIVSGASTITQQLAKQQFLTPDQTYSRKIKELALAYELSQTYSKNQIMELYLNKSFYGSQSYGVG